MVDATAAGAISWRHVAPGAAHPSRHLGGDEIHVWRLSAGRRSGDLSVHGLLARYAGCGEHELGLAVGPHGKPTLPDAGLRFNLSHSGAHTLLALARGAEVGVDLEHPRRVQRRGALLQRCFTAGEQARLAGSDDTRLLRYWAAKEALVKAIGRGIAYGLNRIEIDEDAHGVLRIARIDGSAGPAQRWCLAGLPAAAADGFAAVAWESPSRRLVGFFA
jgi:4'-phosphopantetheinyl transferase